MTAPTLGSLFAGIGGSELGFERAGWTTSWQVEVDKHCVNVLSRHWPDVKRYGDITKVKVEDLESVDLVCGGFPCQDLSVAGRRAGLAGERSGLFFEFMRIVEGLRPKWVLVENVPGLLSSSGGRDMGIVLGSLADLGYGWAYRCIDAKWFGVAQRRRRVFVVGHLGEWVGPAKVLFEREGRLGDSPSGRAKGEGTSTDPEGSIGENRAVSTLQGEEQSGHRIDVEGAAGGHLIAHTLKAEGADASEDGTGRGVPMIVTSGPKMFDASGYHREKLSKDTSPSITAYEQPMVFPDPAHALSTPTSDRRYDPNGEIYIIQDVRGGTRDKTDKGQGIGIKEGGPSYTLGVVERHAVAAPLRAGRQIADSYGDESNIVLDTPMIVRRLTPRECERLQAFPDDWTAFGMDGRPIADGPRYRMLGNAVCTSVAWWIARRMLTVHEGRNPDAETIDIRDYIQSLNQ